MKDDRRPPPILAYRVPRQRFANWSRGAFYDASFAYFLLGVAATVIAGLAAAVGYHWCRANALRLFFPYAIACLGVGDIAWITVAVGLLQYPIYGLIVAFAEGWGRRRVALLAVLILHGIAFAISLLVRFN